VSSFRSRLAAQAPTRYTGVQSGDANGVPPIATLNIGGKPLALDANLTVFGALVAVLVVAALLL